MPKLFFNIHFFLIVLILFINKSIFCFAQNSDTLLLTPEIYNDSSKYKYIFSGYDTLLNQLIYEKLLKKIKSSTINENNNSYTVNLGKYNDATIKSIKIYCLDVFGPTIEEPEKEPSTNIEKIGNKLHFKTSERIIKNNLLLKEGDKFNYDIIQENERIYRALPYIRDARFVIDDYDSLSNSVDIVLYIKDLFPIGVGTEIGDIKEGFFTIWDNNLFGFGRELRNSIYWDKLLEKKIGYEGEYSLKNIAGSFIDIDLKYVDKFYTKSHSINLKRKLSTYKIKYSGGFFYENTRTQHDILFSDTVWSEVPVKYRFLNGWLARNFLIGKIKNGQQNLFMIAIRYNYEKFFDRPQIAPDFLYDYHNKSQFLFSSGYSIIKYKKDRYINSFGRIEDVPTGTLLELIVGKEWEEFRQRPYIKSLFSTGFYLSDEKEYVYSKIEFGGFIENKMLKQANFSFDFSGFSRLINFRNFYSRLFINTKYQLGINRLSEEYISIEDKYGIYGLKSNNLRGNEKFVAKLEYQLISPLFLAGFRVGLFFGGDFGMIGNSEKNIFKNETYSSLRFGFRLRNENLSLNTVQISLCFYPKLPVDAIYHNFIASMGSQNTFPEFYLKEPAISKFKN